MIWLTTERRRGRKLPFSLGHLWRYVTRARLIPRNHQDLCCLNATNETRNSGDGGERRRGRWKLLVIQTPFASVGVKRRGRGNTWAACAEPRAPQARGGDLCSDLFLLLPDTQAELDRLYFALFLARRGGATSSCSSEGIFLNLLLDRIFLIESHLEKGEKESKGKLSLPWSRRAEEG